MKRIALLVIFFINFAACRDFYAGMFKKNDFLVAQDYLYKEKQSFRFVYTTYGRIFKCPITYFRVADRLGIGRGPEVKIIRGGLRKKYVVLRLTSPYNRPISVNIYVGCANNMPPTTRTTKARTTKHSDQTSTAVATGDVTEPPGQSNNTGTESGDATGNTDGGGTTINGDTNDVATTTVVAAEE